MVQDYNSNLKLNNFFLKKKFAVNEAFYCFLLLLKGI